MSFSQVIGQEAAVATLTTALLRDTVPQTLLFVGPDSVGKTFTAIAFAQAVSCKRPTRGRDACGTCVNCTRIAENQHPDIIRIAPDGEFSRIWQFWSRPGHPPGALETLSFAPLAAPKRFYIIEKAETLNEESANSLLKALEEPPPYVQFVLCAPSANAVLPTILSRCQMIRFRQVPTDLTTALLVDRRGLDETEARTLAAYGEGAPGRAFRLADAPELREQREALLSLAERIAHSPPIAAFKLAEDLRNTAKPPKSKKGDDSEADGDRTARGDLLRAIDILTVWHHDLLSVALNGAEAPIIHHDRRVSLLAAAVKYRPEHLAENLESLFTLRRHIARNANTQLATEVLMRRLVPRRPARETSQ
jgi:DNA polymerase-3 subunit delta'